MNIFKPINYSRNYTNKQIKVDVRKHLPLYILMNNIHTVCYNNYTSKPTIINLDNTSLKGYYKTNLLKYPTITYEQYIQDPLFNNFIIYNRDGYVYKKDIKGILFYKSLKSLGRQGVYLAGLGSLITDKNEYEHIFTLCVKKGYEKYVQLCLLLDQEFEFDCLYFIYTIKTLEKHPRHIERSLLKEMLTYCKNYKIDTIQSEEQNINRELEYDFKNEFSKLTNIKSLKEKLNNIHQMVIANGL